MDVFRVSGQLQTRLDERAGGLAAQLARLGTTHGLPIPRAGHAGDGNLHAGLVMDPAMTNGTLTCPLGGYVE